MRRDAKILIADDNERICFMLKEGLVEEGFNADIVYDGKYAIKSISKKNYDVLLLDINMKEVSGDEVLKYIRENQPNLQVIVITGMSDLRTAVEIMKLGAYDFLPKPYNLQQLLLTLGRAIEHRDLILKNTILSKKIEHSLQNKIIGESKSLKDVLKLAERAAVSNSSMLLEGATGTGKELFAEFVHENSPRKNEPFVAVNCASLPDQLIESELFGYEKGAFTDAKTSKPGLVEIADGGTLFLDEIGELSLSLQPKLLRFLENGEFRRIGGVTNLNSNVRVIGATNRNLVTEANNRNFRKDLLFRLNVITLTIPPLKERDDDIILLANYFLQKKSPVRSHKKLSKEAQSELLVYDFPGNVRELEHIIERAIIFSESDVILPKDLSISTNLNALAEYENPEDDTVITLDELERLHIKNTLKRFDWNRESTARALGISQKTLYSKIRKFKLR